MKIQHLIPILFLAVGIALLSGCATSNFSPSGQADTKVIAIGKWSEAVTDGKGSNASTLRGRLLVYAPYVGNVKGKTNDISGREHAQVYLELQRLDLRDMGRPMSIDPVEIYFVPDAELTVIERDTNGVITKETYSPVGLGLQIRDGNDKPYPNELGTINGLWPFTNSCWVTIPYNSTVRLRADLYTFVSSGKPNGLEIMVNESKLTIPPHATNDYYLCGWFPPSTNHPSPLNYHVWQGTLDLPRVKIPPPKS